MPDELKQSAMLEFGWGIGVGGFSAEETIQVRFDHASARAVPLPPTWQAAIRCAKQLAGKGCASPNKASGDIMFGGC